MKMTKFIPIVFCGAVFAFLSRLAGVVIAQNPNAPPVTSPARSIWEYIQFGGTGGLILCLMAAVVTLWRDRSEMTKLLISEREMHTKLMKETADDHKEELRQIYSDHKKEQQDMSDRLLNELKNRIDDFRSQADDRYERSNKPKEM